MRRLSDGIIQLDVWVVPGAARSELKGLHDGCLRVRIAAPAGGGKANRALEHFLSVRAGCKATVANGLSSRRKKVHLESGDLSAIAASLGIAHL